VRRNNVVLIKSRTAPKTTSGKLRRQECARLFQVGELHVIEAMKGVYDRAGRTPFPAGAEVGRCRFTP